MPDETNEYGNRLLPDTISRYKDAALAARALGDFFDRRDDSTFEQMANAMASVLEARRRYENDSTRYGSRVTFVDDDGEAHTAIVLEPEVASMPAGEAYDPYRDEMVDPRESYPLGTVQLIYPSGDEIWPDDFVFSRTDDIEPATSVEPASGPDGTHVYYPGWEYAHEEHGRDGNE